MSKLNYSFMYRHFLPLFFIILSTTICGFGQTMQIDSLRQELEVYAKEDTTKVMFLNELSYQYQGVDYYKALSYAEQGHHLATTLKFPKGIVTAKNRLSTCYWIFGDSELAVDAAMQAAALADSEGLKTLQAESFRLLGETYRSMSNIEKAQLYLNMAERAALELQDFKLLMRVYNGKGSIQNSKKNYDSALIFFNNGLSIATSNEKFAFYMPVLYGNIGLTHIKMDKPNAHAIAADYYKRGLMLARAQQNKFAEVALLTNISFRYSKKHDFKQASQVLKEALQLARSIGYRIAELDIYMALMGLEMDRGDFQAAHTYMADYYSLKDSLHGEKKVRQIAELETRFENEKKEQQIKILEQETRIQVIWRNVLISGTVLMFVALSIILRLQRLRTQKSKELLATQEALNIKLKETDHLKSRFFANISHEFRTPLTLILGPMEEKLNSSKLSDAERKEFTSVQRNANRLLNLVNQLLDLSKLEVGKMELNLKDGNLNEFLQVLVASFDSLAEQKKIDFIKIIRVQSHGSYDADKLEKIISNILINAFKFTPSGGKVELSILLSRDSPELVIDINDNGKGIPLSDQPHVFSPFYQSKHTLEDGNPGTGLGLSLVNELVNLYKGKLHLTSKVNEGTSIYIALPLGPPAIKDQSLTHSIASSQAEVEEEALIDDQDSDRFADSILIVEDNADLRNFIANVFRDQFTVLLAREGEEGFALATEHVPNLILSDVMMPTMNGIDLTSKVKSDERTSHIPVILLTAKADPKSRMEGFETGADDYLAKPFSVEELRVRVSNLIEQRKKLMVKFRAGLVEQVAASEQFTPPVSLTELSLNEKFILRAREVIKANISESGFGVEKFADEMNLSRAQLFRKIKALMDTSPSDFINDVRLQRAGELIRAKADTITQISYAVGFNEHSYFAKRFRKKYGVSPSEYANSVAPVST